MRSLWTRGLSSTSHSCRCYSCINPTRNALSPGKPVSATSRRRLLLGNGVTMFYSTIFAAGVYLDTSAKRKRRIERDEEIEAVKAELEKLQNEEARMLQEWALRRKPLESRIILTQKRRYSTMAATATPAASSAYTAHERCQNMSQQGSATVDLPNAHLQNEAAPRPVLEIQRAEEALNSHIWWKGEGPEPSDSASRRRALQVLAMKRLAVRLLLRPRLAHSYGCVPMDYPIDYNMPKMNTYKLLRAINIARNRINDIQHNVDAQFSDLIGPSAVKAREALERELKTIFAIYHDQKMSLRELLLRVADNLVASQEPIFPSTVALLIKEFNRARQDDIVILVVETLFPARFFINSSAIGHTVNFLSRTKDLHRFNRLLLQLSEGHPLLNRVPWKIKLIDWEQVPIPPEPPNPYLLTSLIKAALDFNMDRKADVWFECFRNAGFEVNKVILTAYLRHYIKTNDWAKGVQFLLLAVRYLKRATPEDLAEHTERLILRMMTLCHACRKDGLLRIMVKHAVQCGIDYSLARGNNDSVAMEQTMRLWEKEHESRHNMTLIRHRAGKTIYHAFAQGLRRLVRKEASTYWRRAEAKDSKQPGYLFAQAGNRCNKNRLAALSKSTQQAGPMKSLSSDVQDGVSPRTYCALNLPWNSVKGSL
ncbi:hypothetical protein VTO42DRAFT_8979 [Malbranchea cinnamomea]